ncbi:15285_t:CDS:1, partial [Funneliformis geosporum]
MYSLVNKKRDDVNEIQVEYKYESMSNKEEKYLLFDLKVEDVFEIKNFAEKQIKSSAKNTSYKVKKFQFEKTKKARLFVKLLN